MWNLKKEKKKNHQTHRNKEQTADWWLPEAALGMLEGGQKVQTSSSYMINRFWGCNIQHGEHSYQHYIIYLKVAKRIHLKTSHHKKKKFVTM